MTDTDFNPGPEWAPLQPDMELPPEYVKWAHPSGVELFWYRA